MEWQSRLVADPEICHGRVCVRGTRVMASIILDRLAMGENCAAILEDYPSIQREDVLAALSYAAELASDRERGKTLRDKGFA